MTNHHLEKLPAVVPTVPHMLYGGDYNPEQWPEAMWLEDAQLMREAGVNMVALGVFAWSKLEPQPGVYQFEWLDRVMDVLHEHGVAVNLATATASPPPWLAKIAPESLPITASGVRLSPGSRQHYCPNSTAYRKHAAQLVQRIAQRYHDHPALALWHINNEYGCHVSACFCDVCAVVFRTWLVERYQTLDMLNEAWGTAFWSQQYSAWDEICPPRQAPYHVNPAQQLDWQRFCSDTLLGLFIMERDIVRQVTPHIPVTTNFMGLFKPLDYWAWAVHEDIVSNDSYPNPSDPLAYIEAAMTCDLMRSLGHGRPWLLMEQATSHVNWRPQNVTKPPGLMRLWSYQALARGADGVMFFQWRASRAGAEQFHSAMIPHAGTDSQVWREVVALGSELRLLDGVVGSRVWAEVALVLDWESWWALDLEGKPSADVRMLDQLRAYYTAVFERQITLDFVHPTADLSNYRLVIAPSLFLLSAESARNIEHFVAQGGTLVMTCCSGIVDDRMHVGLGGYPALLRHVLGLRVEAFAPLAQGQRGIIATTDKRELHYQIWAEIIQCEGAILLGQFTGGFYAGQPAITRHAYGRGQSYYIGTCLDADGVAWVFDQACATAGITPKQRVPQDVELVMRVCGSTTFVFALNHAAYVVSVPLPAVMHNLLTQHTASTVTLEPYGVAVLTTAPFVESSLEI